ncbi:MAG: DUF5686 and carboxypeptidase regulatory-like domain-containing protein [Ignavibacteria bacterium]|nr:DUF5686 and carboxypeptidase regulatory-like domain-containing protein [Ignavibacteria bacterium]
MNDKNFLLIILILIIFKNTPAQTYTLSGYIQDSKTKTGLSFATVKVKNTTLGTTADDKGYYIIKLKAGKYTVNYSYIGYYSYEKEIEINESNEYLDVFLTPSQLFTEEIEVYGEDPANEIIRKAIIYKKGFKNNLKEYNYNAYTKFVIRSNLAEKDSVTAEDKLGILGLLESETKTYFKAPDLEKQVVISKRESANIIRGFALPYIVNFYDETIDLGTVKIPGPVSDDAFENYEFKLKGITSIDSLRIFKIQVTNKSDLYPQFYGVIYIIDSIFALKRVELKTNDAVNINGISDLTFKQKFSLFNDKSQNNFWLPSDIQIYVNGLLLGLIEIQGEVFTIVSEYNINVPAPFGTFDEFIVKVNPDAGKKDSIYWVKNQLIKNTDEELRAYKKIETESEAKSEKISFSPISLNFGKKLRSYYSDIFSFNKVTGVNLGVNIEYGAVNDKYKIFGKFGYGFSDKVSKYEINASIRLLRDASLLIEGNFYKRLNTLFFSQTSLNTFYNSISSLLSKDDNYDYYYSSGFDLSVSKRIIPQLNVRVKYLHEKNKSSYVNTDFSLFNKDAKYETNPPIKNYFKSLLGLSITIDPNSFYAIDWGDGEISWFRNTNFPVIKLGYSLSSKSLNSGYDFRKYNLEISGENKFNVFTNISYKFGLIFINGNVPFQDLAYFNKSGFSNSQTLNFYSMKYREFIGDELYYINIENNFGRLLWHKIPVLNNFDLIGFLNAGRCNISNNNFNLAEFKDFKTTNKWFIEAGFGIGNILNVLRLNFSWRLNNFMDGNNFNILLFANNLNF